MKDNLGSYFKKHLNQEHPKQEDWNTLSDQVWDDAISRIEQPKSDRKLIYIWIIIGFIIISLGILFYFINQLNEKVDTIEQPTIIAQIDPEKKHDNKSVHQNNKIITNSLQKSSFDQKPKNTVNNHIVNPPTSLSDNLSTLQKDELLYLSYSPIIDDQMNTNDQITSSTNHLKTRPINITDHLPTIVLESIAFNDKIALSDSFVNNIGYSLANNAGVKQHRYRLSSFYGLSLTATPMQDIPGQSILHGYQKLQMSSSYGIDIGYNINSSLMIQSGLSIFNVKSWSYSHQKHQYNSSNEFVQNGEIYNHLDVPMPTPVGEVETQVLLRKSRNNPLQDGDNFMAKMDVHQDYQYLSVPLGLSYTSRLHPRHSLHVGGGISWFKLLNNFEKFDAELINLNTESTMQLMSKTMKTHSSVSNHLWTYHAHMGYSYFINDQLSIDLNAHYYNNISKFSNIENIKTNVHGITLKTGFSINF